jgi:asparagine synthase (glutamine-hydrolysing)
MCGIAGLVAAKTAVNAQDVLGTLVGALTHRGPDGRGHLLRSCDGWTVGLGHSRLAILDLSPAAAQPMVGSSNRCWLTYNGEVYNFAELRRELEAQGHVFASRADSEVVLKAYEAWGLDAVRRLRGMFGFGLWDERSGRMVLARDPLGIKPLYYYQTENLLLFASEVRALLATGLVRRKVDSEALVSFLRWGSVAAPLTIIEGVRSLLPGRCLVVQPHHGRLLSDEISYGEDLFEADSSHSDIRQREIGKQLRQLLEQSVRLHMVSDVPLGVFLSGGIDSAAITALMSRVSTQRPRTFSVVFGESQFSEAHYARIVAEKYRADHREIVLSEGGLLDLLPSAIAAMDQPTVDGLNTFVISDSVRKAGITVALSGLGGDELFAGYPSFRRAERLRVIGAFPIGLRRIAAGVGRRIGPDSVAQRKLWELIASDASPGASYSVSRQLFADEEIRRAIGAPTTGARVAADPQVSDVINSVSCSELRGYMANTLLRDTDCMSMAHGLEVRVPFVDPVVVKYVLGLPGKWKVRRGRPKALLLEALGELLPVEVWRRRKRGFTLPLERWLRSALKPRVDEVLADPSALRRSGVEPGFAADIWSTFKTKPRRERWARPWAFYVLASWCDTNRVEA